MAKNFAIVGLWLISGACGWLIRLLTQFAKRIATLNKPKAKTRS
jgi:hypothetical protein